jgi:maleylpyruvate isomerase
LRIALNLKGLPVDYVAVDLRTEQHLDPAYRALHPQGLVPLLQVGDDGDQQVLIQSPAIIEWLEERYPVPPLLPKDADARARVRALAESSKRFVAISEPTMQQSIIGVPHGVQRARPDHSNPA